MDIIEIDSSDSEDEIEIGYTDSQNRSYDDATDQWRNTSEMFPGQNDDAGVNIQRHPGSNNEVKTSAPQLGSRSLTDVSSASLGNNIRRNGEGPSVLIHEGVIHNPQLNGHEEVASQANFVLDAGSATWGPDAKPPSQHSQKRTLPHYLASPPIFKHSVRSHGGPVLTSKQKDPTEVELNNGSELYPDNNANGRGISSSQRRSLPPSLQPAMNKAGPEGSRDYQSGNQFHNVSGTSHDSVRSKASDQKVHMKHIVAEKDEYTIYEKDGKRILPSSFTNGLSVTNTQPKASIEVKRVNTADGVCRLPPSSFKDEHLIINNSSKASIEIRDDVHNYGTGGTYRVLPPSLMHGRSFNNSQVVGTSDVVNHIGFVEERHVEHDERPIYQEALQNLGQPKLEDDLPEGLLSVSLLKHQRVALAWMVQKEKSTHCAGGILADDQGLGKTVSMISLIQKQMTLQNKFTSDHSHHIKPEALNIDVDDDDGIVELEKTKEVEKDDIKEQAASTSIRASHNGRPAAGTLVVCPASVLRQWAHELDEKVTSSARLSVLVYHGGTRTKDPGDLAKYDVVLTTYSIVTNEVQKQPLADDDDSEQRNMDKYGISSEFSTSKKRKQASNARSKGKKKGKGLKDSHFDYDSGPLGRVRWFRVILDEAQTIKNHRTQVARACSGLRAKRRWCLSGTPIQNSIDDLYSYFRFLKYDPYDKYGAFCSAIKYPISRNASHGFKKLQAVLRILLLRRTKGTLVDGEPIINLPPKSVSLKKVDFSKEERSFYLRLEADSRQQFKEYAAAGTLKQNYANILLMLLRLRQACDHPILVKGFQSDTVKKDSLDMARQLPKDMLKNLLKKLEASLAICGVCNDPPEDAIVTMCGHVFCYQCVSDRLTGDDNMCPASGCKDILGTDSAFSRATLESCISDEYGNNAMASSSAREDESTIVQSGYVSSKIRAALEILNSLNSPSYGIGPKECNERDCCQDRNCNLISEVSYNMNGETNTHKHLNTNPETPAKAIVFSQWTSMLDLLELSLNQSLIQYRRLDGTMSLNSRDRAVKDFNTDPEVTVMIMSLKAGNLGLNMVAACHVILLDLWWNPTTEDQAVDRAHRIGQTRPVTVSRLTVKDTVEDRILALQEEKRKLVSSAFGEDQGGSHATRLTVDDLRYLFMV